MDEVEIEITPIQLKERLGKHTLSVIDVREPHEWDICRIEGAKLIPLSQFQGRINEISTADDVVLYCKMGSRSLKALKILQEAGFRKVQNLKGGILAWSRDVDPTVPRY